MAIIIKKESGTGIPQQGDPVEVISNGRVVATGIRGGGGGGGSSRVIGGVRVGIKQRQPTPRLYNITYKNKTGKIVTGKVTAAELKRIRKSSREQAIARGRAYKLVRQLQRTGNTARIVDGTKVLIQTRGGERQLIEFTPNRVLEIEKTRDPTVKLGTSIRRQDIIAKMAMEKERKKKKEILKEIKEAKKLKKELQIRGLILSPSERAMRTLIVGKKERKNILEKAKKKYFDTISRRIEESERVGEYIKQQKRLQRKISKQEEAALIVAGFQLVGSRALRGFTTPFIRPVKTIKGIAVFVGDIGKSLIHLKPKGTVIDLINEFTRDPIGTAVEMYAVQKAFSLAGKAVKPLSKTKIGEGVATYANSLSNKLILLTKEIGKVKPISRLAKSAERLRRLAKTKAFKNKAIRKTIELYGNKKLRTVPRSRRKALLREIKRRARQEPTSKELIKKLKTKKRKSLLKANK